MVRKLMVSLLGVSVASVAQPRAMTVASVTIVKSGIYTANPGATETPAVCASFRPSSAEMMQWFKHSRQVTKLYWFEQLDFTPCSAAGTLQTARGERRRWELDASGRGIVFASSGDAVYLSGSSFRLIAR